MTSYVCAQLSNSVPQTCEIWQEDTPFLPVLTQAEAISISGAIFLVCVVAYAFKTLFDQVKRH